MNLRKYAPVHAPWRVCTTPFWSVATRRYWAPPGGGVLAPCPASQQVSTPPMLNNHRRNSSVYVFSLSIYPGFSRLPILRNATVPRGQGRSPSPWETAQHQRKSPVSPRNISASVQSRFKNFLLLHQMGDRPQQAPSRSRDERDTYSKLQTNQDTKPRHKAISHSLALETSSQIQTGGGHAQCSIKSRKLSVVDVEGSLERQNSVMCASHT